MMSGLRLAVCSIALCSIAAASAAATRAQQPGIAPPGLAVEIALDENDRTYLPANRSVWLSRFRTVAGWQRPAGLPPVQAVQVVARAKGGDALRVAVSVKLGERYLDEERQVASYEAREGDALVPEGLREFGVVPITLKVVRARTEEVAAPFVETGVSSIEVLAVDPAKSPPQTYDVSLRNHSARTISALELVYEFTRGPGGEHWWHQPEKEPLAVPGEVFGMNVFATGRGEMLPDGSAPGALRRVRINSVVYADGTFEGDERGAAWLGALWRGRRSQLERALPLIERALAAPESDAAVEEFRARVAALTEQAAPGELEALLPRFARLDAATKERMREAFESSLHHAKRELLDSLRQFEETRRAPLGRLSRKSWFEGVKATYEKLIARM